MTTRVEAYNARKKRWVLITELEPTAKPGSFSNNTPEGKREMIVFQCAPDNSKTTISSYNKSVDINTPFGRFIQPTQEPQIIAELTDGESHTMLIKTDRMPVPSKYRFIHIGQKK